MTLKTRRVLHSALACDPHRVILKYLGTTFRGKGRTRNIWDLPKTVHRLLHSGKGEGGAYNRAWFKLVKDFMKQNRRKPNANELMSMRDSIVRKCRIGRYR